MEKINPVINLSYKVRFWDLWQRINPDTLTVVNYSRIGKIESDKNYYKPKLSATPKTFSDQLDYLQKKYSIVSAKDLVTWLRGGIDLPDRAALLTFDDCYQDNFRYAFPALKKRWLPGLFFLATNYIGNSQPMSWDLIGYAMSRTQKDYLSLNLAGTFHWESDQEREDNVRPAVEAVRSLPAEMQPRAIDEILTKLDVAIPQNAFEGLYLTWDQVSLMALDGIEFGSKSLSQPVLTSIELEEAKRQIVESKSLIEKYVHRSVTAFSYPRGLKGDYNKAIMRILHQAGYYLAFTNLPGPDEYSDFPQKRLAIRRISVTLEDSFAVFVSKLNGVPQLEDYLKWNLNLG